MSAQGARLMVLACRRLRHLVVLTDRHGTGPPVFRPTTG
jgi:hypothetical protein